ncbi:MAG: hypothetical protein GKC10_03270 [Methanosarcinales archaeon]|nr:hypothetical protein [Methanosarcinales archaeon]
MSAKINDKDANKARKDMVMDIILCRRHIPPELKELLLSKISEGWIQRLETITDITKMSIAVQVIKAVSEKCKNHDILTYTADLMALNALPLEDGDLSPDVAEDVMETLSLLKRLLQFRIEKEAIEASLAEVLREYHSIERVMLENPQ